MSQVTRCEFSADDFASGDSEAYLVSPALTAQYFVSLYFIVVYNISSPDTDVELVVVSRFTEQVIHSEQLPHQHTMFETFIPSFEPIYIVLHVYSSFLTTTSSSLSVAFKRIKLEPTKIS